MDVANKLDQYLAVAKGEINRLDYIVTQFLQAIRPAPLQIRPATLNEVLQKTLELLRPELDNRGITIKTKLARQLPATPIDPTQTQQALLNLIKNAMQAMTKGRAADRFRSGNGLWVWLGRRAAANGRHRVGICRNLRAWRRIRNSSLDRSPERRLRRAADPASWPA